MDGVWEGVGKGLEGRRGGGGHSRHILDTN